MVARVREAGFGVTGLDVTIVGARPRLGDRLDAIRDRDRGAARGCDASEVNVKASTGNLSGDEGAGRSIAARVVATLRVVR